MRLLFVVILCCVLYACGTPDHPATNDEVNDEVAIYEQVLDRFLNVEQFQGYLLQGEEGNPHQIIIADDEIRGSNRTPVLTKFGHPVRFVTKELADSLNKGSYYWVVDYVRSDSTARMQMLDPTRNLLMSASFDLVDGQWKVHSTDVQGE